MPKRFLLSVLPIIFCAFSVFAQTDFSGSWKFVNQESVSGNLYSNGSPKTISITQTKTNISIEKITATGDGKDVTLTDMVSFDGKASETITTSKRKKVIVGEWSADKKTFTETVNIYSLTDVGKVDHKVTDIYSLSDDDKTLSLDRKDENGVNGEVWESVATYEK
jgi:hypothetical protein